MTSLRLGHLYGAGEINAYLVNTFMRQAAEGEDLHLHAPARARRDFTYAGDAAHGILDALRAGVTGVFNIGSGAPATNAEIAQAVVAGFDSPSRIVIDDPSASEGIAETGMDLTASARVLGYRPRTPCRGLPGDCSDAQPHPNPTRLRIRHVLLSSPAANDSPTSSAR
ncbi:NAD-dependent epimerase/dehydratase family protein [Rhodococcus hoagii]|nr:NAD-dependent epimerase/dehydratase family protein [Prescottella equi]